MQSTCRDLRVPRCSRRIQLWLMIVIRAKKSSILLTTETDRAAPTIRSNQRNIALRRWSLWLVADGYHIVIVPVMWQRRRRKRSFFCQMCGDGSPNSVQFVHDRACIHEIRSREGDGASSSSNDGSSLNTVDSDAAVDELSVLRKFPFCPNRFKQNLITCRYEFALCGITMNVI